jgi:tRNA/tmRNA/rRNA uracil-C5-methylase (TrmA/RlmC/RlmD family)
MGNWAKSYIKGHSFIDMYGGLGFFSIMLGENFSQGLLIENVKSQVEQANNNFRKNNIKHIRAEIMSAEDYLSQKSLPETDLLIVDPPRPGLTRKVREGIHDLNPGSILYISCNPSTQARDVDFLIKKCCYSIKKAALFDLYPQTHHIETALLLNHIK